MFDILESINTTKATGPSGISPRMIKEAADSIAEPLAKLFNLSLKLREKQFPSIWEKAYVIPVHKNCFA